MSDPVTDQGKWLRTKRGRVLHHVAAHYTGGGGNRRVASCGVDIYIDADVLDGDDHVAEAARTWWPKCEHCEAKVASDG